MTSPHLADDAVTVSPLAELLSRGLRAALHDAGVDPQRVELRADEPMARHTTSRTGGPADLWVRPRDAQALRVVIAWCAAHGVPWTAIGAGTNLIVRDGGLRGIAINLAHLSRVEPDPTDPCLIHVDAGASTGKLWSYAARAALGGVEFLAGVPGSVGGGLVMNAGTWLGEFVQVVEQVDSLTAAGALLARSNTECGFGYRHSRLGAGELVTSGRLRLTPRARADIEADSTRLREHRAAREPKGVFNNGSTFKNPPGEFAGRLIEQAGLKGLTHGGAFVSPAHANWLVSARPEGCTAADLLALIDEVRARVHAHAGVELHTEVRIFGDDAPAPADLGALAWAAALTR